MILVNFSSITPGPQIRAHNWKLFFLFLNQTYVVGTQKNMFKLVDKKINAILRRLFFLTGPLLHAYQCISFIA